MKQAVRREYCFLGYNLLFFNIYIFSVSTQFKMTTLVIMASGFSKFATLVANTK